MWVPPRVHNFNDKELIKHPCIADVLTNVWRGVGVTKSQQLGVVFVGFKNGGVSGVICANLRGGLFSSNYYQLNF